VAVASASSGSALIAAVFPLPATPHRHLDASPEVAIRYRAPHPGVGDGVLRPGDGPAPRNGAGLLLGGAPYLALQPAAVRGAVGVVALDQWRGYLGQVRDLLPRAEVVDHFHLVRLANQLVTEVGQRTQQEVSESCHHSPSISLLTEWQQTGIGPPVWPPDQWSITKDEVQEFVEIDALLNNDPDSIDAGMERFHALVTSRANWLFDHAMKCVPDAKLFSADAPVDAREIPLTAH
jgi:hypothetical protein